MADLMSDWKYFTSELLSWRTWWLQIFFMSPGATVGYVLGGVTGALFGAPIGIAAVVMAYPLPRISLKIGN